MAQRRSAHGLVFVCMFDMGVFLEGAMFGAVFKGIQKGFVFLSGEGGGVLPRISPAILSFEGNPVWGIVDMKSEYVFEGKTLLGVVKRS